MPLLYLRRLTSRVRTDTANRHLARYLAFIAGAINAGGFLAVRQYTSHMSGIVSAMADKLATGSLLPVFNGAALLLSFFFGALLTTLFIRWGRVQHLDSIYALPLIMEALLLLLFGLVGHAFTGGHMLATTMLLCFTMGLQNAVITKISNAVIRTTHITGMITDIGILLGRSISRRPGEAYEQMATLQLLLSLVALFFVGGVIGALGFRHMGFFFSLPLAALLAMLALLPVLSDLRDTRA